MILHRVGFFRELPSGSPDDPSVYDVLKSPLFDESKILQYLKSGRVFIVSPGIEKDILMPEKVIGPINLRTDGVWAWPDSLSYYLKHYHVFVPEEFLKHVRTKNYVAPDATEINVDHLELSE